MSTTQLDFTVTEGELSVPQLVSAVFANTPIGYLKLSPPPGVTATTWLTTELYQTSSAAWVYADARALKAGTYCTAVRVETLDSTGTKTLSFLDVGAKVTVSPKSSSSSSASADLEWGVYAGGAKPTGTASISYPTLKGMSTFSLVKGTTVDSQGRAVSFFDGFKADGATGLLRVDTSSSALDRSLLRTGSIFSTKGYPKNLTYLVRVAPVTGVTYGSQQRFLDVELSLSEANATEGARIVFSVRNDSVAKGVYLDLVEQSSTTSVSGTPLDMSVPHIYQISTVLNGPRSGSFTVYADGSDTPVVPTITSNDLRWAWLPANFIQIGDNGASAATSDIDWMVWSDRGAFKPSELKGRLPAGIGITTGY